MTSEKIIDSKRVPGRAYESYEKRAIIERFLAAWEEFPDLRFGQLLINSARTDDLFYLEDYVLAAMVEDYAAR